MKQLLISLIFSVLVPYVAAAGKPIDNSLRYKSIVLNAPAGNIISELEQQGFTRTSSDTLSKGGDTAVVLHITAGQVLGLEEIVSFSSREARDAAYSCAEEFTEKYYFPLFELIPELKRDPSAYFRYPRNIYAYINPDNYNEKTKGRLLETAAKEVYSELTDSHDRWIMRKLLYVMKNPDKREITHLKSLEDATRLTELLDITFAQLRSDLPGRVELEMSEKGRAFYLITKFYSVF